MWRRRTPAEERSHSSTLLAGRTRSNHSKLRGRFLLLIQLSQLSARPKPNTFGGELQVFLKAMSGHLWLWTYSSSPVSSAEYPRPFSTHSRSHLNVWLLNRPNCTSNRSLVRFTTKSHHFSPGSGPLVTSSNIIWLFQCVRGRISGRIIHINSPHRRSCGSCHRPDDQTVVLNSVVIHKH